MKAKEVVRESESPSEEEEVEPADDGIFDGLEALSD